LVAPRARQRKLTLRGVAEELGVAPSTIRDWLRKLKDNNMVYEPRYDLPPEYDGVVEDRLRRLVEQEQGIGEREEEEEDVADAIDYTQAAFILGVSYKWFYNRLQRFQPSKGRYTPLSTLSINNVLKSLAGASSSHSETNTSCHMADDGDSLHSAGMRNRRTRHGSYNHRHDAYGDDDGGHDGYDDDDDDDNGDDGYDDDDDGYVDDDDGYVDDDDGYVDDDDDDDDDADDELCRRLTYDPNWTLPSFVDDYDRHDDDDGDTYDDDRHEDYGYDGYDDDDDDELCRRLAYQPNCTLASVVDDRILTRTEHHIRTIYRGYLQRMLGIPGEYDRLNEHTLRRLSGSRARAREAARQKLTQRGVAEELGVSQQTICNWLRKLKENDMVYEPQHDLPPEYDGVVEARLRRLAEQQEQEQGEGEEEDVADAIDYKQAAFILGVSYKCVDSRLRRYKDTQERLRRLMPDGRRDATLGANSTRHDSQSVIVNAFASQHTTDTPKTADNDTLHTPDAYLGGKRHRSDYHDYHRGSLHLTAQRDCGSAPGVAEDLTPLEAALLLA
jgi:transposase